MIFYKSIDPSIATVSDDGLIHAVKTGTTKITAKTNDGKRIYQIIVKKRGMVYPEFSMIKVNIWICSSAINRTVAYNGVRRTPLSPR